jgi:hypothetical protein
MKVYFGIFIIFIIGACSSPKTEVQIEQSDTTKIDSIDGQKIKLNVTGSDSTGQIFLMQINEADSGFIKITRRGWVSQHMGYFVFDSTANMYAFTPTQTFETDLCKSYHWGDPKLVIRGNNGYDGIIAHVEGKNIDTSFLLRDTLNVLDFEEAQNKWEDTITVRLEFTKEPKFQMNEMTFNYYSTGICLWNDPWFNIAKIQITPDQIIVYDLHEKHEHFKNKVEYFDIKE